MSDPRDSDAPDAVQSLAQSRIPPEPEESTGGMPPAGVGTLYGLGVRLLGSATTRPYQRQRSDPLYRPLSIYALDPGLSKLGGATASIKLQYEPLEPGPRGAIVEVNNVDVEGNIYPEADLDSVTTLLNNGYPPSISSPQFHQQMTYAVTMLTYANFKLALGRNVPWAFTSKSKDGRNRLKLRPFGAAEKNAWYDREAGEIVFGYFVAEQSTPVAQQGVSKIYTSLSHDIIVHEVSHALLDGLRAHFFEPTHPDVLAFHEAFADLIALFQHFAYPDVVREALSATRGSLLEAKGLVSLAQEFGRAIGSQGQALRTMTDLDESQQRYDPTMLEPHERGKVLAQAMFSAFEEIYRRRIRRFIKLATGGSGMLPPGDLSDILEAILVQEARKLANQFLSICVRAIDYCPPVNLLFGDYLRAVITADRDLVPDDDLAYRETIIRAFGKRHIFGESVESMTEDALVWRGPRGPMPADLNLKLSSLRLTDDLSEPADALEIHRLAGALGRLVSNPLYAREFGLISPRSPDFVQDETTLPIIESIRIARRIGPDKQLVFDLVAEVTQRTLVRRGDYAFPFYGGSTVILDSTGAIRFIISKRLDSEARQEEQWRYISSSAGATFWTERDGIFSANAADIARRVCARP